MFILVFKGLIQIKPQLIWNEGQMFKIKYELVKKLREEYRRICTATSTFHPRIGSKTEENSPLCGVLYRSLESVDKLVSVLSTEDGTGINPRIWSCESFIIYQSSPQR